MAFQRPGERGSLQRAVGEFGVVFSKPCVFNVFENWPRVWMNIKLGGGFKYVFFAPIWGRSPIWLIFCLKVYSVGLRIFQSGLRFVNGYVGQRRKPRCLSYPAAAWRSWKNLTGRRKGDGVQSCRLLRPIPFKRAHGLPAWRGSCRTSVSVRKAASVAWNTATQNISPPQFGPNRNQGSSSTQVRALLGANISVTRVGKDDLKIIVSASSLVTTMFALENERNVLMWLH